MDSGGGVGGGYFEDSYWKFGFVYFMSECAMPSQKKNEFVKSGHKYIGASMHACCLGACYLRHKYNQGGRAPLNAAPPRDFK